MTLLSTERLDLISIDSTDLNQVEFLFNLLNDPNWIKFIGDRNIKTIDDARKYAKKCQESFEKDGFGVSIVVLKSSSQSSSSEINKDQQKMIGIAGLLKRDYIDTVDIGFAFLSEYIGKGLLFVVTFSSCSTSISIEG
jgi:ribosomal-protein-alanine N-acetyltransferase